MKLKRKNKMVESARRKVKTSRVKSVRRQEAKTNRMKEKRTKCDTERN